jgi:hypothetical protein
MVPFRVFRLSGYSPEFLMGETSRCAVHGQTYWLAIDRESYTTQGDKSAFKKIGRSLPQSAIPAKISRKGVSKTCYFVLAENTRPNL